MPGIYDWFRERREMPVAAAPATIEISVTSIAWASSTSNELRMRLAELRFATQFLEARGYEWEDRPGDGLCLRMTRRFVLK